MTNAATSAKVELRASFLFDCIRIAVAQIVPLKKYSPATKLGKKYLQIRSSVQEIGLVEPPVVIPDTTKAGSYFLIDGHMRLEALKDIGVPTVECMVAVDDDTYTYKKRVNRLSAIQEHRMILAAAARGVSVDRLAAALGLSPHTIRQRFRMLEGICTQVVEYLADKPCPSKIFKFLRHVKPLRQIEAAELMVGQNNFSMAFVAAIVATTRADQLLDLPNRDSVDEVSAESMARLERELATLQAQNSLVEDTYGPDVLHLVIIKNYLSSLFGRAPVE
jgi:AcrR family transcriptional regulator